MVASQAAVLLTLVACLTCRLAALPQGHKIVRDDYAYSRQYMYGRRDHGAMQMHGTDKRGQAPWRAGVKRGFYGMYDHYMIGRVQPLEKGDAAPGQPQAAEVKGFPIGVASDGAASRVSRPVLLLLVLPLLAMV
ncbi:uncharacterized protein LOC122388705 [Amphibalanus amphitrite]|uniref:uncharacterized protein LOC122388705 n=1 Tax=Amphibalanus amphitrite TaxID=1232801 RepID=UPI001C8FABC1|nr:uncharacterized protein LOC122388705 [Amphibalanus amphitrite]